jgi:hypothetical protein
MINDSPVGSDLIPELEERRREYQDAKRLIRELVDGLNDEDFNRRPDDHSWSVAECVDHLLMTGKEMYPLMEAAIEKAGARSWRSAGPFNYGALGKWFVSMIDDSRLPPKKTKAPRIYRPAPPQDMSLAESARKFEVLQDEMIHLIERSNGLDLRRIRVRSAITPLIRLSLGTWFDGLAGHQRRHLWQAEQVKARLLKSQ